MKHDITNSKFAFTKLYIFNILIVVLQKVFCKISLKYVNKYKILIKKKDYINLIEDFGETFYIASF